MSNPSDLQPQRLTLQALRLIGYALLLLSLLDFVNIFIPLRLMNPEWELQTITELVERVPVPLIGLALAYYEALKLRRKIEIIILKGCSMATLWVGIAYFLILPLLIVNTFRLDSQLLVQGTALMDQRMTQVEQVSQRLGQATSKTDIAALYRRISGQTLPPNLQAQDLPALKQELLGTITKEKPNIRKQVETTTTDRRLLLFKNTVKVFLGAMVAGVFFIYFWFVTRWIRRLRFAPARLVDEYLFREDS